MITLNCTDSPACICKVQNGGHSQCQPTCLCVCVSGRVSARRRQGLFKLRSKDSVQDAVSTCYHPKQNYICDPLRHSQISEQSIPKWPVLFFAKLRKSLTMICPFELHYFILLILCMHSRRGGGSNTLGS